MHTCTHSGAVLSRLNSPGFFSLNVIRYLVCEIVLIYTSDRQFWEPLRQEVCVCVQPSFTFTFLSLQLGPLSSRIDPTKNHTVFGRKLFNYSQIFSSLDFSRDLLYCGCTYRTIHIKLPKNAICLQKLKFIVERLILNCTCRERKVCSPAPV